MQKQISIIVPIFNGEKHLVRCIDSIINQTFGIDRILLLLLNDGSSDSSISIANSYAERFPNSIKVYSQKNMGTAKTRNKGVSLAKTKYIMFVDQDDFIDNDYCETFYRNAESTGADVVAGGFRRTDSKKVFYTRRANDTIWYPFVHAEAWAKIHRTDFIKKIGAEFFDNVFGEDIPFTLQETLCTSNFKTIDYTGYNWFINKKSITRTVHRDFSKLNLSSLLKKLGELDNSQLTEYYIFIVSLYAFIMSSVRINKKEFKKNLDEVFFEFKKIAPNFVDNKYIKDKVCGCPFNTYMVARIFYSFYQKGWYNLLYIINFVNTKRISKK
jgi:Glycosyltransferases involved in cell wall biogenesis